MKKEKLISEIKGKLDTRERILRAAADEFIEYGYYGGRMQRIADRAKVNKAMIHYYFSSKEKAYEQVLRTILGYLLDELNNIDIEGDGRGPEEKMEAILDVYERVLSKYNSYFRLLVYEIISGGKVLPEIVFENAKKIPFNPVTGKIYKYFEKEIKAGRMKKVEVLQVIISLVAQMAPLYIAKPVIERVLGRLGIADIVFKNFMKTRRKFVMTVLREGILIPQNRGKK